MIDPFFMAYQPFLGYLLPENNFRLQEFFCLFVINISHQLINP